MHLFGLRYWDDVLSAWAGRSASRLRVRYDPRDISCVFVEGPDGTNWPVRFADLSRPRITLGEHRLARAALRKRGVRATDEQLIFDTIQQQRAVLEEAVRQTKITRRRIERRDRSLAATGNEDCDLQLEPGEEPVGHLPPLVVEEWS